jgi:hypothetical protein
MGFRFSEVVLSAHCLEEQPFVEAPPVTHIKLYLTWLVRQSCGQIDEKIIDVTMGTQLASLKRAIKTHTNYQYSRAQNDALSSVSTSFNVEIYFLIKTFH